MNRKEAECARRIEAREAVAGTIHRKLTKETVRPPLAPSHVVERFGVALSESAWNLWQVIDRDNTSQTGFTSRGERALREQTNEELGQNAFSSDMRPVTRTPEQIAASIEELSDKGLIAIGERDGRRFISTLTPRTCGLY